MRPGVTGKASSFNGLEHPVRWLPVGDLAAQIAQLAELTRQLGGREIRQHAGNRHRHMGKDLALLRQRHPAAGGDKLVGRQRHIISVAPEHHQIVRVVGVAGGDGAAQLTPAFEQGDLRCRLVAARGGA